LLGILTSMSRNIPVIELINVTKRFGQFAAVSDVELTVTPGEVVGFVGANGAGKTTTIGMLLGFLRPSDGKVRLFGKEIQPANAHGSHRRVGYAAGDMELPAQLTGAQYLRLLRSSRPGVTQAQYDDLIRRFSPQLDKKIHSLSRGNKQKIALVAAFLGDPEVVILDEPTSGLDPVMQDTFLDLIREYKQRGNTVFMSSHYLQEVMEVCDRVVLMSKGKVVEDIQTSQLQAMGGKQVRITSGYRPTKPPKGATEVESEFVDDVLHLRFVFKGDVGELQRWVAAVKQLRDVEISEYNLEEAFKSLYQTEEAG
jgi:ABC-2 type transport system ATP-binding protein